MTELTATATLEALEQRILAGETVSPADLAAAQAAVRVDQLTRQGEQSRAERRAAEQAEQDRAQAKVDAAQLLSEDSLAACLTAWDAARQALETLLTTVDAHNDAVTRAGRTLSGAGVTGRGIDGQPLAGTVDLDPNHHVVHGHGQDVAQVVSDGQRYSRQERSQWVATVVGQVARAHQGLPVPGRDNLEHRLGDLLSQPYTPVPLRELCGYQA